MKRRRGGLVILVLASAGAAAAVLVSCSTVSRTVMAPPMIEGATFTGNKACLECHANISRVFPGSPHARVHFEGARMEGQTGCESCHGPASKHIEFAIASGRAQFIVNPGKDPTACFNCHLQTHAEFNLPQHHPLMEGKMNCVQCHDPHGADIMKPAGGLAMARLNETCAQCHRDQTRPVIYEHEAMRDGCTVCHQPHGSVNAKMLIERDNNLCLKCHAQLQGSGVNPGEVYIGKEPHQDHLRVGGCWSAGCHTAVHGSNVNPHMRY